MTQTFLYDRVVKLNADIADLQQSTNSYGYNFLYSETTNVARQLNNLRHRAVKATSDTAKTNVLKDLQDLEEAFSLIDERFNTLSKVIKLNDDIADLITLVSERKQGGLKEEALSLKTALVEILEAAQAGDEEFVQHSQAEIDRITTARLKWRNESRRLWNVHG